MNINANTPSRHASDITARHSTEQTINNDQSPVETARTDMRANTPTEEMSNISKIAMSSTGIAVTAATVTVGLPMIAACTTVTPILAIAAASGAGVGSGLTATAYPWVSQKPSAKSAIEPILTGAVVGAFAAPLVAVGAIASGVLLGKPKEGEEKDKEHSEKNGEHGSSKDQPAPQTGTAHASASNANLIPIKPQLKKPIPIPLRPKKPMSKQPVGKTAARDTLNTNRIMSPTLCINLVDLADRVYYEAPYCDGAWTKIGDFFDTSASSKTHRRRRMQHRQRKLAQNVGNFKFVEARDFDHYYAASYKDDKSKIIVVSFRGSDNPNDFILKDFLGIGLDKGRSAHLRKPIERSINFTRLMRHKYEKHGYEVLVTGHSLGGYYAQRVAQSLGVRGMSFNAPGTGTKRNPLNRADFINIRMDKDPVSRIEASNHYGEVLSLPTPKNEGAHQIETCMAALRKALTT